MISLKSNPEHPHGPQVEPKTTGDGSDAGFVVREQSEERAAPLLPCTAAAPDDIQPTAQPFAQPTAPPAAESRLFRPAFLAGTLLTLAATIAFFEITDFDLRVQDFFFNFDSKTWLMPTPKESAWAAVFFYTGPKVLIIAFAVVLLPLAVLPTRFRARLPYPLARLRRTDLFVVLLTLASAPALVGFIKQQTNIHYPRNIVRYGGDVPYVRLFEKFPETPGPPTPAVETTRNERNREVENREADSATSPRPCKRAAGFPAGHASGGFALMSLAGLATTRRCRLALLTVGLAAGWWMGLYQMFRGDHYLSHTLVSMLLGYAVFLVWRRIVI